MNHNPDPSKIKIASILLQFCSNPTPFKPIASISDQANLGELKALFDGSDKKRKVVSIDTADGQTIHIGWNELNTILESQGIFLENNAKD